MKKLFLILLLVVSVSVLADDFLLQQDDGNLYLAWSGARTRAVRFWVSNPCTLKMVYWGRYTKKATIDTIFVWSDNKKQVGTLLYSDTHTINTNRTIQVVSDTVQSLVIVDGLCWIGIGAFTSSSSSDASYFMSDTIGRGTSYWDSLGFLAQQNVGDYIIRAKVSGANGTIVMSDDFDSIYVSPMTPTQSAVIRSNLSNLTIDFIIPTPTKAKAQIFDISGRVVKEVDLGILSSNKSITIDKADLRGGFYIIRVFVGMQIFCQGFVNL